MTATVPPLARPGVTLDDAYTATEGTVLLSGIRALVRLTLEQRRLDIARGHDTRVYVSGYEGSPLGTLDREMARARAHLEPAGVLARPAVNEELAATAVAGTQLLGLLDKRRHEGVTGIWYGKAPGLDRAADAIRHGNLSGTMPLGGAVAWIGDDPASKSSTVPSSSEPLCRSLLVPLFAPGSVEELLTFGLHAIAMSRYAGLWTAMKIVADIADASATVDVSGLGRLIPELEPRAAHAPATLLPPTNLDAEEELIVERLARARAYVAAAGLNRVVIDAERPRLTLVAAGMGHQAVLRALSDLGLDARAASALGLRVVALGMPWPLDRDELRRMLHGTETVLVVEDKAPFLEGELRDALYRLPDAPVVLGKEDAEGRRLLPVRSALVADDVARALGRLLAGRAAELPAATVARLDQLTAEAPAPEPLLARRTPFFCSGCPHNTSTRAEPDQLVGVGIGCHTMVVLEAGDRRGEHVGMTQMGGEGAQWLGLEPFTDDAHFFQNLGDGTFHHSGSLAIRAASAAGANITYKLLYNDAVAMTGGQQPVGKLAIPDLTRWLALEGVRRIVVTTPEPQRYRGVRLDPIATVRHRDDLMDVQRELAGVPGVTVLIHDDMCATEKRRLRKRGKLAIPKQRVAINERVCEGCGDCGEKSSCLSVVPVETELGRKTQIHQSSCNLDLSCLKGDCPSFLLVEPAPGQGAAHRAVPAYPTGMPAPVARVPRDVLIRMPGVGGTGVVTVSAILQMAAHLDGRSAAGLEQIGLAQKGGPVISDVRLADRPVAGMLRAGSHTVDVLLGLDLLGAAAADTLATTDPARTVGVISSAQVATAAMVTNPQLGFGPADRAIHRIRAATRGDELVVVDALALAEHLFGDHMPANLVLLGAAWQHGCIPVSEPAILHAIELNGAGVEANRAAFEWGRAAVADPDAVAALLAPPAPVEAPATLPELVARRAEDLRGYQDAAYAAGYVEEVMRVAAVAQERGGEHGTAIARAYAEGLHKLMAYKDEYEVARLHLDATEQARIEAEFGPDAKVKIMLHPPVLRAMGLDRKLALGPWVRPGLRGLAAARRLRGTRLDPFGRTAVRRLERALITEYRGLVDRALAALTPETAATVADVAQLPDMIRGYEGVKERNVAAFRAQAGQLLALLESGGATARAPVTVVHAGGGARRAA
jgi:indolepyruvate ferredoxin oxidoreductase